VLGGIALAFWYHFCAGIRHLVMDTGRGLEKAEARRSSRYVFAATALLALLTWYAMYALAQRAGGAA
jgi:succinate dehydrogenase / fumarate reductase cytochrome b subunit